MKKLLTFMLDGKQEKTEVFMFSILTFENC